MAGLPATYIEGGSKFIFLCLLLFIFSLYNLSGIPVTNVGFEGVYNKTSC